MLNGFPRIAFSTLGPGANNHTFDFGFSTIQTTPTPEPVVSNGPGGPAGSGPTGSSLPQASRLPGTGYPPETPNAPDGWVLAAFGIGVLLIVSGIALGLARRRSQ